MIRLSSRAAAAAAVVVGLLVAAAVQAARPEEPALITRRLDLRPGMSVADVGAGSGEYTSALARAVGPTGRVYATEIEQRHLDAIASRMAADGVSNVSTVLGDATSTGLPSACCDRILLRLVYHHFTDPEPMRASLARALKPGGRILVVDVPPQPGWRELSDVPRDGHGIDPSVVIREMESAGFEVLERFDDWPGERNGYGLVFGIG